MAYSFNDSFTTQALVQARCARGAFDATSSPTLQEVTDAAAQRGAQIEAAIQAAGANATVNSGSNPINGETGALQTLFRLCQLSNTLLAGGDALEMHGIRDAESASPPWVTLWEDGQKQLELAVSFVQSGVLSTSEDTKGTVRTATSTGGVPKADFPATGETERARSSLWNMDTKL